jgi:hypothetical protein
MRSECLHGVGYQLRMAWKRHDGYDWMIPTRKEHVFGVLRLL